MVKATAKMAKLFTEFGKWARWIPTETRTRTTKRLKMNEWFIEVLGEAMIHILSGPGTPGRGLGTDIKKGRSRLL
jgi:hypothetical protein